MDLAVMGGGRRFEAFPVKAEVVLGEECRLPIVAPLNHNLGNPNQRIGFLNTLGMSVLGSIEFLCALNVSVRIFSRISTILSSSPTTYV